MKHNVSFLIVLLTCSAQYRPVLASLPQRPLCIETQEPGFDKLLLCEIQSTVVPYTLGPKDSVTHSAAPYI